jgi:hypothetical protein
MSLMDSLATYFGSAWLGYQKKQFASGQVGSLELGDLPWTGRRESMTETFYLNALLRSQLPVLRLLRLSILSSQRCMNTMGSDQAPQKNSPHNSPSAPKLSLR